MTVDRNHSVPFAPDGCKNHLLPLIVNRHVQEGGLLLVEDDVSVVAQKEGDSFGVALCCSKVKRSVLWEKIERENPGTVAGRPLAILLLMFVELLKRRYERNYLLPKCIKFKTGIQNQTSKS